MTGYSAYWICQIARREYYLLSGDNVIDKTRRRVLPELLSVALLKDNEGIGAYTPGGKSIDLALRNKHTDTLKRLKWGGMPDFRPAGCIQRHDADRLFQ